MLATRVTEFAPMMPARWRRQSERQCPDAASTISVSFSIAPVWLPRRSSRPGPHCLPEGSPGYGLARPPRVCARARPRRRCGVPAPQLQRRAFRCHDRPLDDVLKFADVTWPRVDLQCGDHVVWHFGNGFSLTLGKEADEVIDEKRDVLGAFAQRRHPDGEHIQSIKQVSAKGSLLQVKGTVARLEWKNPHIYLIVETVGAGGKRQLIQGEGLAITQALVDGLQKEDLRPGAPVVMRANPNRSGPGKTVRVLDVTTQDGEIHPFYAASSRARTLTPAKSLAGNWAPSRQSMTAAWGAIMRWPITPAGRALQKQAKADGAHLRRADAVPRDARRAAHHPHRP